ncbi:MAG: restriction endonuclease subunit S [Pseudomonadota bacterium]
MGVKPGYKQTEVGITPEEWRDCDISDLCLLQRGFDLTEATRKLGDIPVYSSSGLSYFHNEARLQPPAVITGRKGMLGKVFYVEEPCWPHDTTLWVKDFKGNHPRFVALFLGQFKLERFDAATSVPTLNRNNVAGIPIKLPPLPEQLAIATALRDVDGLLGGLDRLIAKKRDLKQAAVQQLLTGQTRLPGFYGEWENTHVQDVISDFFCGPSPTCEERNIHDDEWGVLKTTAATKEEGWDWTKHKTLPRVFWNKPHLELKKGDVIVTKAGPRHRVGVAAWVDYVPPRIIVSGKMIGLRPRFDRVVSLMLAAAVSARDAQVYLDQRTTGMAESQVNFENAALLEAPIRIPHFAEQTAIAKVFTDMDAELLAMEQRRGKTRALKQAMMQELLTGRTRLV